MALHYLRRHSKHVRAAVLNGVAPPHSPYQLQFATALEKALAYLFDQCQGDPACSTAYPELESEWAAVLERFSQGPVEAAVTHPETGSEETIILSRGVFVDGIRHWTRLSCHDFDDNQVRLQLLVLAYNLANFLRRLALPFSVRHWTLTTLRDRLIKSGAKVVRHARYVTFQLAESVPRRLRRARLRPRLSSFGTQCRHEGQKAHLASRDRRTITAIEVQMGNLELK